MRDARICAGALQGNPHSAAEAELRLLLAHRAGAGAEPADRPRSAGPGLLAHVLVSKYATICRFTGSQRSTRARYRTRSLHAGDWVVREPTLRLWWMR